MAQKQRMQAMEWMERPVFRKLQKLTPERLNRIQDHQAMRLRHTLIGLAGPGVVYGFALDTDDKHHCRVERGRIYIGCGLAIDCHGRHLYWPGGWIGVADLAGDRPHCEGHYTLWVHYAERYGDGIGQCGCDEEDSDWVREGVVFSLTRYCKPAEEPCPEHRADCASLTDYVCGRAGADEVGIPPDQYLDKLCAEPGELCPVDDGEWLYDPEAGLSLACVTICDLSGEAKDCDPIFGFCAEEPQVCQHRPYVYRNRLLFELIRGYHLDVARVRKMSFEHWLSHGWDDPLPWQEFARGIHQGLSVWFDKPIQTRTLHRTSVFVSVIVQEYATLFQDTLRLPVQNMAMLEAQGDYARGVRLEFHKGWLKRQVDDEPSRFSSGAIIEFTVRGAMLRDECDCMLDARPLGFPKCKPGQAMPGDDFVVAFCVAPRPRSEHKSSDDETLPGLVNPSY